MALKFRSLENIIRDLILETTDLWFEGWEVHSIGTTSDGKFSLILMNNKGKEKRIYVDQFDKE